MYHHQVELQKKMQDMLEHGMQKADEDAIIYNLAYTVSKALSSRAKMATQCKYIDVSMHSFCEKVIVAVQKAVDQFYKVGTSS